MTKEKELLVWLENIAQQIKEIEEEALRLLEQGNSESYVALMHDKAKVLAGLYLESGVVLKDLPKDIKNKVADRLGAFSSSAARALELDSVFYMSALLYPDDHKKGEPNNLELFVLEVKKMLGSAN